MSIPAAAVYFDRMRAVEHELRHVLPPLTAPDVCRLPAAVQQLAGIIGLSATLNLVDKMGGLTLRIPHGDNPQGRALLAELAKHVGEEGARALAQHYGASQLYIPNCKNALIAARDTALLKDRRLLAADGLSERDIVMCLSLRYRISDRYVWKILKKPQESPTETRQQASLF